MQKIDFKKLLGFETVAATVSNFDFRDETVGSKLGAKIGSAPDGVEPVSPSKTPLELSKLLGFDTISNQNLADVNFQDETLCAKLGAKVGVETSSDARLKREITQVATREDGLPIYSFRYLWDDEVHVGVMAQDLLRNETWAPAVVTKEGGGLFVDYARLGLRMTTLDEWQAKGMAALTRQACDNT